MLQLGSGTSQHSVQVEPVRALPHLILYKDLCLDPDADLAAQGLQAQLVQKHVRQSDEAC